MATPKMPLHSPLPAEIKGLEVQHFYGRSDYPSRPCKVIFNGSQITVEKTPNGNGYDDTVTFCSPNCIQMLDLQKDNFTINIRHHCVDGWKMVFTARNKTNMLALKDAITRARCDQILSANLLLDDRCRHLHLETRGYTDEQVQRMREETTAALPKGTQAQFKASKWVSSARVPVSLAVVNGCPAMSFSATKPFFVERFSVEEGVVNCLFGRGITMQVEAADFQPPRLVTPPTSEKQIYVCDSRDLWNPRQAWVFTTDRAAAAEFLPVLMHAWMVVDGSAAGPAAKTASAKAKKDAPKKAEHAKALAKAVASKRGGAAKTVSKAAPAAKTVKKVTPKKKPIAKKTAPPPKAKKVTAKKEEKVTTPAKTEARPKKGAAAKTATTVAPAAKTAKKVAPTKAEKVNAPARAAVPKRGAVSKAAKKTAPAPKAVKNLEKVGTPVKAAAPKRGGAAKKVTKTVRASKPVKKVLPTKVEKGKKTTTTAAPKSEETRASTRSAAKAK